VSRAAIEKKSGITERRIKAPPMFDDDSKIDPSQGVVAYLCAEFGVDERLPIYAGGLGVLAGDHLKTASDLDLPLVAVGLLYREGYFRQTLDGAGQQHAQPDPLDLGTRGLHALRDARGQPLEVLVPMADHALHLNVWRYDVGRVPLFLLDADHPSNSEADRAVTARLYGGGSDTRLLQEIVLGIGAVRALRALGLQPSVWHLNEGHAAFSALERIREAVQGGLSFGAARELVAARTVFTTHTPVPAGHDVFTHGQLHHWLGEYLGSLQTTERKLFELGSDHRGGHRFNMTALALRTSRFHNGVSRIHGDVASRAEAHIWPGTPPALNPITYVTNAVHLPTFLAPEWRERLAREVPDWRRRPLTPADTAWIGTLAREEFAGVRHALKRRLLDTLRARLEAQHHRNGLDPGEAARAVGRLAQEDPLVLGFARRFATYKRAALLLHEPERLLRLLSRDDRPTLLVFAGKAHPHDAGGQELIRRLYQTALQPEFLGRLLVVEGYDIALASALVQGCDVWLNTPEFPMEASGTSGMKAAVNGGVNVSILDGWWAEGCDGQNGYGLEPVDGLPPAERDRAEARVLLDVLEGEVQRLYFEDRADWERRSRHAMRTLIPTFGSARMLRDYMTRLYRPAAAHGRRMSERNSRSAVEFKRWKKLLESQAPGVGVDVRSRTPIEVRVALNGLHAEDLRVEAGGPEGDQVELPLLRQDPEHADFGGVALPAGASQLRVLPAHTLMAHRYELGCIAVRDLV
jgi:glycogen phosphorylase